MKGHKDSIRSYRLTWRTRNSTPEGVASHHAYTDSLETAEGMATALRMRLGVADVEVFAWVGSGYSTVSV